MRGLVLTLTIAAVFEMMATMVAFPSLTIRVTGILPIVH